MKVIHQPVPSQAREKLSPPSPALNPCETAFHSRFLVEVALHLGQHESFDARGKQLWDHICGRRGL